MGWEECGEGEAAVNWGRGSELGCGEWFWGISCTHIPFVMYILFADGHCTKAMVAVSVFSAGEKPAILDDDSGWAHGSSSSNAIVAPRRNTRTPLRE